MSMSTTRRIPVDRYYLRNYNCKMQMSCKFASAGTPVGKKQMEKNRKLEIVNMKIKLWIIGALVFLLTACGPENFTGDATETHNAKTDIVCTIFPAYDWTRQILGDTVDAVNLTLLTGNGADMHSYQPTAADIALLSTADIVICVGGETERWILDALEENDNEQQIVINMMETLQQNILEEEIVEGMEHSDEECTEECNHVENAADEHVWLSLQNAKLICEEIADALISINPDEGSTYDANAENYCAQLETLRERYREAVEGADSNVLIFADRFPFRYFTEEWGLEYYAAFPGCFAETEASFETIIFLAEKADQYNLPAVIVLEHSDAGVAETVIENSQNKQREILVMNSMQSVSMEEVTAGTSYIGIMEDNLAVLIQALDSEAQ